MSNKLSSSAQKVQAALRSQGFECQVVELPDSTRTAKEAAQAIGCRVEQIVKSLVFRTQETGRPVLVVASGANRVDVAALAQRVGEPLEKADAGFIRQRTGYVIGGVPPTGHLEKLQTFIDADLLQYETLWAAAGTPHAVFQLTPNDLVQMTGGAVVKVS